VDNPRGEKVAVVDEVKERFRDADAALLTEYRGLNVAAMAELRRALRAAGGDYKIYKNTLVRRATRDLDLELDELLVGPTAIAFVRPGPDGAPADPAAVAKALKEFSRTNEALVVKGGVLGTKILSADETRELAELPSREVLLAQLAGALQAPMVKMAQLLNALPQKFAYAVQALIDEGGASGEAEAAPVAAEAAVEPAAAAEDAEPEPEPEPAAEQTETETETETQES